jgi:hypothetical protein
MDKLVITNARVCMDLICITFLKMFFKISKNGLYNITKFLFQNQCNILQSISHMTYEMDSFAWKHLSTCF